MFEAQPDSEIVRDARLAGMDEGSLKALMADLDEGTDDGIWPAHVEIVRAFCAVGTQWRLALRPDGFGIRAFWLGLDYTAVKVALDATGTTITPELWQGLTTMEQAAAAAMNGVSEQ